MTRIPSDRAVRPDKPVVPGRPPAVPAAKDAMIPGRGLHTSVDAASGGNPFVPDRLAPGAASVDGVRSSAIRLPAPRELVTAYRDGFRRGTERWLGSVLPAGVRTAFGAEGTRAFASAVLEGLPRAFMDGFGGAGVAEGVRGDLTASVFTGLRDRLLGLERFGGKLHGKLTELGGSALERVSGQTREVLEKLLSGGGKGLLDFAKNLVRGVTTGFTRFAGNIQNHLRDGLLGWLKDALPDGLRLPQKFDAKELLGFAKDILKLVGERVLGKLEGLLPKPVTDALQWSAAKVEDLVKRGPGRLADAVLGAVNRWVGDRLAPAAERAGEMARAGADTVERTLEKATPVAIDFLAGTLGLGGLGGLGGRVKGVVGKVRGGVESAATSTLENARRSVAGTGHAAADTIEEAASNAADAILDALGLGS